MAIAERGDVVIAIDGPSGVGKSTVARRLAERLGFRYVDSGALYRAVGWAAQAAGVPLKTEAVAEWITQVNLELRFHNQDSEVWIDGQCMTPSLEGETVGAAASAVATVPAVRQVITSLLRSVRGGQETMPEGSMPRGVVMEGRDIGTVVFPDATVKFFLDASIEIRGQRRFQDMQRMGQSVDLSSVVAAVAARDAQDRSRKEAPLVPSSDAHVIDATDLTIDDVVERMLSKTHI